LTAGNFAAQSFSRDLGLTEVCVTAPFTVKIDKDPADELFKHCAEGIKALRREAKKRLRERERKAWWDKNGKVKR